MSVSLTFDQPTHRPDEQIHFQVNVEGEPTSTSKDVTFTGSVTLPGQTTVPVSGTTQVVDEATYGPFTADGYTVVQDEADPSRYTATPTA